MARTKPRVADPDKLRSEWLGQLNDLVKTINQWVIELDWSTRQIAKKMKETPLGSFEAPALLMQRETTRILLDPIAKFVPGAEGAVDLYLMPAYDDIASLYLVEGQWRLHYVYPDTGATSKSEATLLLTKETLGQVLKDMCAHVS